MKWRLSYLTLLLVPTFLLTGCGAEEANQAAVQTAEMVEDLERENEELQTKLAKLEWENADLRREKEQREAAIRARAAEKNRTFSQDAAAGIWTVTMKCTESTCGSRSVGDVITEVWNLTYSGGQYTIEVINGASKTNRTYSGYFTGRSLHATFSWRGNGFDTHGGANVTLDLRMDSESTMTGTREVLTSNPCGIEYAVTATRNS